MSSTQYPAQIDNSLTLPLVVDNLTPVQGAIFNPLRSAVLAIESTLGVQPNGSYGNVATRLTTLEGLIAGNPIIQIAQDLGGTPSAPLVIGFQGHPVSSVQPTAGQILAWNGIAWVPTNISSSGLVIFAGDLTGTTTSQNVVGIRGIPISSVAPTVGQALTYNGTNWIPGAAGSTPVGAAGGDLSSTYPNPVVAALKGIAVPTPTGTNTVLTYDAGAFSWGVGGGITALTGDVTASGSGSVAATVTALRGNTVQTGTPLSGNALVWSGSAWVHTGPNQDLSGTYLGVVVQAVNGTSVPVGTSNAIGNGLYVSSAGTTGVLAYSALNLAGGSGYVTGVLPSGNQASQTLTGDVIGTTGANTLTLAGDVVGRAGTNTLTLAGDVTGRAGVTVVGKLQGTVVLSGTAASGKVLEATSSTAATWTALPTSLPPSGTASGDLSSSYPSPTVVALRGKALDASLASLGASQDGYALTWVNASSDWQAKAVSSGSFSASGDLSGSSSSQTVIGIRSNSVPVPSGTNTVLQWTGSALTWGTVSGTFTAGGDLSGTSSSQNVIAIHGATVPIAGSLTTGNGLYVTGASALSYSALNLAGGSNYVTGVLPIGNQASQTMTGDVIGTTGANTLTLAGDVTGRAGVTVVGKVNGSTVPIGGSLTTGNVLQVNGSASLTYGALNLANTSSVTGTLPIGNQASQTMGGDASGTTASATVIALRGKALDASLASLGATQDGYSLTWVNASSDWQAKPAPSGSFTAGGDLSGTSSSQTVIALQGHSVTSGSVTEGQVLFGTASNTWGPTTISGDITSSNSTAGKLTVIALQGNAVESQSLGASQDGYVLTWHNASTQWQALAASGGGGGSVNSVSGSAPIVATGSSAVTVSISAATDSTAGSMSAADKTKLDQIPATPGFYGDGSNGSATCDGTTAVTGMTRASTIYTMTQDLYFTNLTINTSVTVLGNGWRLFVSGTFTNNGSFNADGGPGALGTSTAGTAGGAINYLGAGTAGGTGGGDGGGSNNVNLGGVGGSSASATGGTVMTITPPASTPRTVPEAIFAYSYNPAGSPQITQFNGGTGGGSMSIDTGATGGGGGGVILVASCILTGNGVISAKGGAGHSTSPALYGSGGGGGGFVTVITHNASAWTGTISAAGGAGGAGSTTPGSAGGAGLVIQLTA